MLLEDVEELFGGEHDGDGGLDGGAPVAGAELRQHRDAADDAARAIGPQRLAVAAGLHAAPDDEGDVLDGLLLFVEDFAGREATLPGAEGDGRGLLRVQVHEGRELAEGDQPIGAADHEIVVGLGRVHRGALFKRHGSQATWGAPEGGGTSSLPRSTASARSTTSATMEPASGREASNWGSSSVRPSSATW